MTTLEALPHLLPSEDVDASRALEKAFRKRRVGFRLGTPFEGVERTEDGVA